MCRYDHGRVFWFILCLFLSYVSFFCVLFWNFYVWKHYSDIELGVVGAGTLMIVL